MLADYSARLKSNLPRIKWQSGQELAPLSYFRLGGPAQVFATIKKEADLIAAVHFCHDNQINWVVVGGMSNLIVPDEGYDGVVLHNATQDFEQRGERLVYVSSGWRMNLLVPKLIALGLGGLESFLSLPGTVGGAIYNNAHFQEELFGDYAQSVKAYDPQRDVVLELTAAECEFGYDETVFHRTDWVILGVVLRLQETEPEAAQAKAKAAATWRVNRQPLNLPSSGCIFRNIPNDDHLRALFPEFKEAELFPAGFLIDKAGLKGVSVGGAQVSTKHAAFIVNTGQATASDVIELITLIKKTVKEKYQVDLTEEVCFLLK